MRDGRLHRRVLITGGLGFLGSHLALRLVEEGAHVTIVDRPEPLADYQRDNLADLAHRADVQFCDVCDTARLAPLLSGQDVVFWLAAQVSHLDSMRRPLADLDINYRSLLAALEHCRHQGLRPRFVFASTRQVYGRPESLPVTEQHPVQPVDVNGVHKAAAEQALRLYAEVHGLPTVSLRLTNCYGPRMDLDDPEKGVAGVLIGRATRGEPLTLFGGDQRRDFNHVDDVVAALLLAGEGEGLSGRCFNLGHPQPCTLREFAATLGRLTGTRVEAAPFPPERKAIDIGSCYCDFSAFTRATGWRPQLDLETGLQRTLSEMPRPSLRRY